MKERAERGKAKEDGFDEHEAIFLHGANVDFELVETCSRKFLILGQDQVLATNKWLVASLTVQKRLVVNSDGSPRS